MASDTLSYRDCERFYLLRDTLALFAHFELGLEDDFFFGRAGSENDLGELFASIGDEEDVPPFNEDAVAAALDEVFQDPSVIDSYIAANIAGFGKSDLAIVESWKTRSPSISSCSNTRAS